MLTPLKNITIILSIASLLYSCKEKEPPPEPIDRAAMLMNGRWKLVEAYSNTEKNGIRNTYNLFNDLPECEKDNILKFDSNSEIEEDQGAVKCHPADSQIMIKERWALVGNSALEFINENYDTARGMNILELSDELLHLRFIGTAADSTNFENTYKYEHLP